jgi:hypothetical protein
LELPVRPPDPADAALKPFGEPINGPGGAATPVRIGRGFQRELIHDAAGNSVTDHVVYDHGLHRLDDTGLVGGERGEVWHTVVEGDPLSATSRTERVDTWRKDDIDIEIRTRQHLWADRDDFHVDADIEAFENGRRDFSRVWNEVVPRVGI